MQSRERECEEHTDNTDDLQDNAPAKSSQPSSEIRNQDPNNSRA